MHFLSQDTGASDFPICKRIIPDLQKNVIIYILSFGRQKVNSSTKFTWFIQKA